MGYFYVEPKAPWSRSCDRIARDPQLTESEKRVLQAITLSVPSMRGQTTLSDNLLGVLTGMMGPDVRVAVWNLVSKRYISRRGSFCPEKGTVASYRLQNMPRGTAAAGAALASDGHVQPSALALRARYASPEHS